MKKAHAAVTVHRPRQELEQLWTSSGSHPHIHAMDATVTFRDAPGDRGTEIHVEFDEQAPGGKLAELVQTVTGAPALAKVKDELRRFKQEVETGVIPRSDATPEGERAVRKLKQRPAQPLSEPERVKAGV